MWVRRLLFGLLWILSLVAISFYGGTVSYGLFFAVSLVPVISLCYLGMVYRSFRIYQELGSRNAVSGQPIPWFFVLQNDAHFAFTGVGVRLFSSFSRVEEMPDGVEYELLPGDKFTFRTNLVCRYRGEYEVGVKEIVVTDFFRLFRIRYAVPGAVKATVLPRVVRLRELRGVEDIAAFVQREAHGAESEPDVVVRDYVEGDALKQVHWKATARERKLKVRGRIGEEKQGLVLLCDTGRYSEDDRIYLPLENKILEVLLALGMFFAEREVPYTVSYSQGSARGSSASGRGGEAPAHSGQGVVLRNRVCGVRDFQEFYNRTAAITFERQQSFPALMSELAARGELQECGAVFCVVHEPDEELMELTERLAAQGAAVVVYAVTDRNMDAYVRQGDLRRRIVVIPVEGEPEEIL